jgi:hypothetical protein
MVGVIAFNRCSHRLINGSIVAVHVWSGRTFDWYSHRIETMPERGRFEEDRATRIAEKTCGSEENAE